MIGLFDSGSGGLTVLRAIRDRLPSSDVLYFGDIRNAPYGPRSREELNALTIAALRLLSEHGATSVVSACNSVSASLAISLVEALPFSGESLVEMAGPTVSAFRETQDRVVLFATQATIDSRLYQDGFALLGKEMTAIAIPSLAGAIEAGASLDETAAIVETACSSIDWARYDTVILGCTHFPLVREVFRAALPPRIGIFDPAEAVADRVEKRFWPREAGDGKLRFLISADSPHFRARVASLFPDARHEIEVIE